MRCARTGLCSTSSPTLTPSKLRSAPRQAMPSHSREHSLTSPFLENPPLTPWRYKAELHRRSMFLKRIAFLTILLAFAVPIWIIRAYHQEAASQAHEVVQDPLAPSPAGHAQWAPAAHRHPVPKPHASEDAPTSIVPLVPVRLPAVHDDSGLAVEKTDHEPEKDPVTFSLLMWSEASASEGVILIKVCLCFDTQHSELIYVVYSDVRVWPDADPHHLRRSCADIS